MIDQNDIRGKSDDEPSTQIETSSGIWRFDTPESFGIPDYCGVGLMRWVLHRHPVGDFLRAVICNNFLEACMRADQINRQILPAYALWLWNNAPGESYGSKAKYDSWLGLNNLSKRS